MGESRFIGDCFASFDFAKNAPLRMARNDIWQV
jgi:hypothetical protein